MRSLTLTWMRSLALAALVAILPGIPAIAGAPKEGDDAVGVVYALTSPDTHFSDTMDSAGLSWSHFWKDHLTTEAELLYTQTDIPGVKCHGGPEPENQGGCHATKSNSDNFMTGSLGLAYHWKALFLPVAASYTENQEGLRYSGGVGVNFWPGAFNVSVKALYVTDPPGSGEADGAYQVSGAVRYKF